MAKLAMVYGMRLFPAEEMQEVREATIVLKDGRTARITMHLLEGSVQDIRRQFDQSVGAFFEFYPEI
ncbi:MAG: allantoinase [Acidobacteria bacterium RIFCSPHIGHO2_02_FULL_67_57]|nr:MAG: allantoinase [Acidobacteria bacterium RIFCSPHIGHO2_02_FULL_67_57]